MSTDKLDTGSQSLFDKEQMLENILQSSTQISIIAKDLDRKIITWNEGARRNYGYEASEAIGKSASILNAPEDSAVFDQLHEKALREGAAQATLPRVRKDGSRFPGSLVITRRDGPDGKPVGYLLMSRDVTEELRLQNELTERVRESERNAEVIQRQRDELMELASPVMEIWNHVLALPLIGTLDSVRAQVVTETLLNAIGTTKARVVILDISGVPTIDTEVAQHIIRTTEAARLMGAQSIISGIRPATAQTIVHLGINLGGAQCRSTMRDALQVAFQILGPRTTEVTGV